MSDHSPARWTGPGKRSVQAQPAKPKGSSPVPEPEPVAAPETETEITLDDDTGYMKSEPTTTKVAPGEKPSTKTA